MSLQNIVPEAIFLDCYDAQGRVPPFLTGPPPSTKHDQNTLHLGGLFQIARAGFELPSLNYAFAMIRCPSKVRKMWLNISWSCTFDA